MQYRGMIKWTQLAIPEHMEMIRTEREKRNLPQKPELDPQAMEELMYIIEEKIALQQPAKVTYWQQHEARVVDGFVKKPSSSPSLIEIKDEGENKMKIELEMILSIQ
ncbi:YolD-like family protein [Alkalihalophilus pseudofirmus]|uniref:YolD-like family protein n=1 Tax=Alkalihalophilus pseudofirmus TaxID=79885 RepID=UPI00259B64B8|nr:YolD-like family protein [Alkalihalophilus pseudofirmus]WEG15244.1 YolD-like family protein [Alkalihalophilus pseudofirmus]